MNEVRDLALGQWEDLGTRLAQAIEVLNGLAGDARLEGHYGDRLRAKADALRQVRDRWEQIGFRDDASSFDLLHHQVASLAQTGTDAVREGCSVALDYLRSY